jgi:HD-GYP domain-containing protein (c-di-GMP phosphodiesterase class II)
MTSAQDYISIRISTLTPNLDLDFDVFVKLGYSDKLILYLKKGDFFEPEQIIKFKNKNVRKMFINLNDEQNYQNFLDKALADVIAGVDAEAKAGMACEQSGKALENLIKNPTQQLAFTKTEVAAENMVKLVSKNTNVLKEIMGRTDEIHSDPLFRHAIQAAALATCLAEHLKLKDQEQKDMAVACLMMDIGRLKMPVSYLRLFLKPLDKMSNEDFTVYKEHPRKSIEMLQDKKYISKEILDLIMHHEERKSGNGFPQGVKKLNLNMELVSLCNLFSQRMILHNESPDEIIKDMMISQLGNFEITHLQALKKLLSTQKIIGQKKVDVNEAN